MLSRFQYRTFLFRFISQFSVITVFYAEIEGIYADIHRCIELMGLGIRARRLVEIKIKKYRIVAHCLKIK